MTKGRAGKSPPAGPFYCFTHLCNFSKCPREKHKAISVCGKYVK